MLENENAKLKQELQALSNLKATKLMKEIYSKVVKRKLFPKFSKPQSFFLFELQVFQCFRSKKPPGAS